MSEFLHMGGYGFYVWTSYGLFALTLLVILITPIIRRRGIVREVQEQRAQRARRAANRSVDPTVPLP